MTMYTYPYQLGGNANGRYRAAVAAASSSAAQQASAANLGTRSGIAAACQNTSASHPVENAGIRTGEIVAFRAWQLWRDGFLHSMFVGEYVWMPRAVEHAPKIRVPYGEGLHAFKTLAEAKSQYDFYPNVVFGEVDLWGEVVEYERGYKAEFAAIKHIIDLNGDTGRSIRRRWRGLDKELIALRKRYDLALTSGQ